MCKRLLIHGARLIFVLLLINAIRIHCFGESVNNLNLVYGRGKDEQSTHKITFLNESLQFPSTINDEVFGKIRNILCKYEDEAKLLGKQAYDCRRKEDNRNCHSILVHFETAKTKLRKELNNVKRWAENTGKTQETPAPNSLQSKFFFGNGFMLERIFNVFRDYSLYINFAFKLNRRVKTTPQVSIPTTINPSTIPQPTPSNITMTTTNKTMG
ncbi:uncharacterized protein LOC116349190 [Contarinia nasturtii]|uniref:uncharacterized protein LOC116349190 n=1 Tax=Contarinia nasturtii TaxID=265458 RepID=UPI0012D48DCB|nr:uncharacterized protein LOC116349190 [Contarinia nasturtii]